MSKPDSVLVYTAGNAQLYQEIRQKLAQFLAPDEITVFNVTIEAIRKQPWNEKSTICVILASTSELDDEAWQKIQEYFNCNGKIIFVCQNQLLASITHSTSSKQDLFRFAFDTKTSKLKENNKEFAKFLEKNLKILKKQPKHAINETFCAKKSGANFSVVLKKDNDTPLFLYMQNSGCSHASVLFSDATTQELLAPNSNLLRDSLQSVGLKIAQNQIPSLTRAIMTSEFKSEIDEIPGLRLGTKIGVKPELLLRKSEIVEKEGLPEANRDFLPIEIAENENAENLVKSFNFKEYFESLTTKIGAILVYSEVMTTTMDVCESLNNSIPAQKSIIVVANRQISGKGRGGNEFISPEGSALFTFSFFIEKSSRFARNVPILQHVFCVALVEAAKNLSYSDLPLRIKWPNDLYFERSHKVGGMLICCKSRDDGFAVQIGCGINVTNEKPTICLNDMIPAELKSEQKIEISREKLIAETLNRFQWYLNDYESNGPSKFRQKYYEFWLHSQQEILLADFNERVQIRGIDEYGYLEVRSKTNPDKIFSIGDDGNTFDMMKGLIRHKF